MSTIKPIINLKPTNPTIEEFLKLQKFGLQPYDRAPNDYLRFVAKIFTAWRDPNDTILNYDPFDDKYGVSTGTSTTLQATSDKSIIAYVDGFVTNYNFVRLVSDAASTDLTSQDTGNSADVNMVTYTTETGDVITIDKAKYGEYHRFSIEPGICFIDNQLVQVTELTEWWFRMPQVKDYTNGIPNYELGQFIVDPLNVYSLLCNKNYKIILSYEYITQFESNSARLRFVTDDTAVDEPYFLIASFSTDEYGRVHQTLPINEKSVEKYKEYVVKENLNSSGQLENFYYLKDINPQYLDKKYMANHKNLFIHLKSQLLTELSNSKIANVFHCKEITEEIDPSISSGDFIYYDGLQKRWFPAEVSRQDFDKVHGLYLRNVSEGTNLLFTSGIIEISDDYSIVDSENQVLRNLIPGTEYFLADNTGTALDTAPFIDSFIINDSREIGYFTISTEVIAKASNITIEFRNDPSSTLPTFSLVKSFPLDSNIGEQRKPQQVFWEFSAEEITKVPTLKVPSSGLVQTEKIMFNITLDMVESSVSETNKEIIEDFKLHDTGDITISVVENSGTPNEKTIDVKIEESTLYIKTNGLPNVLLTKGTSGSPLMKLFDAMGTVASKDYNGYYKKGDRFQNTNGTNYKLADIQAQLQSIVDDLKLKIYNSSYENLGLNDTLALLGSEVTKIDSTVLNLEEAIGVLKENYKNAKLLFQSTNSTLQLAITTAKDKYLLSKNTYDHLVSQHEEVIQKRNAMIVKLDAINMEVSSLESAKTNLETDIVDIQHLIDATQVEIDAINTTITNLQVNINTLKTNLSTLLSNIKVYLDQAETLQQDSFNYNYSYYGIDSIQTAVDTTDSYRVLPRILKVEKSIYTYYGSTEASKVLMDNANTKYKASLNDYTTKVINGSLNYAEQLLLNEAVNNDKLDYDTKAAEYRYNLNKLLDYKDVKDKLKETFETTKAKVKGELFATCIKNNGTNSTWGNSDLYTFTAKLSSPLPYTVRFEFIYKEDTQDILNVVIPSGSTQASASVNIQMFPDTNVDSGMPKWVAYNSTGVEDLFNVNKFNQILIDDLVYITGDTSVSTKDIPNLFTLDGGAFGTNPVTAQKPTQINTLRDAGVLDSFYTIVQTILDLIDTREQSILDLDLSQSSLNENTNLLTYKTNYRDALQSQKDLGTSTINIYDAKITSFKSLYTYYKTTTDTIQDVLGTDISYDVAAALLTTIDTTLVSAESTLQVDKTAYEKTLDDLKVATDTALGEYVSGIAESNNLIALKQQEKQRIQVMFNLYEERTKLVISIYNNLNSLISNGLFNGEWTNTDTFLMNRYEYQDALENQLVEIFEQTILIPSSSVLVPSILNYTVGVNGLQYPMDLQPWIFVKTSGKISTRNYPGATSIGFALNERTLILNIQHRPTGDISEFLNVYGNENDFNDQLISKYRTTGNLQIKNNILASLVKINTSITDLTALTAKNQTSKTRTVNGKSVTITTSLNDTELTTIDNLVEALVSSNGTTAEQQTAINKKEFLIRLIYSKFFGNGSIFNTFDYLLINKIGGGSVVSSSSWYATPGNLILNNGKDPFDTQLNVASDTNTFKKYMDSLFNIINGGSLSAVTMKELFYNKLPLYKDLDIVEYILTILPQPLIDYNSKLLTLTSYLKSYVQDTVTIARYNLQDDPESILDDFENPSLDDTYINSQAEIDARKLKFDNLISIKTNARTAIETSVGNVRIDHENTTQRIMKYNFYKTFLNSLREDIKVAISYYETKLANLNGLKIEFTSKVKSLDADYLTYNNKMNKLPNVMWDIFRITNFQRTKWNYTYLALRIMGIQKELNNVISGNSIQYSPINSQLSELRILRNQALTNTDEAAAYTYETQINALEQKKTNFTNMLKNMVNEFNVIQLRYSKPTITPEATLQTSYLIEELYMQDPKEYNLSYEFSPYPAYKELV